MRINTFEYEDLEDGLDRFLKDSLLSQPGEKYQYSSYGYALLGAVLENACGKKFNDIVQEYILFPAGMKNTFPELTGNLNNNTGKFYYSSKGDTLTIAAGENYSYKWPAGGYLSTATDLAEFGGLVASGRIVSNEMLKLLFDSQKTNDGKVTGTGFGFRIGTDSKGRKVVHHGGESAGARAFLLIYPGEKLSISLVANVFRAPLFEGEAETIAAYFLKDFDFRDELLNDSLKFTTTYNDKVVNGEIKIADKKITGFTDSDKPVSDIVLDGDKIRLIALSSSGIINFWLLKENGYYTGKWGYDKEMTEMKFE